MRFLGFSIGLAILANSLPALSGNEPDVLWIRYNTGKEGIFKTIVDPNSKATFNVEESMFVYSGTEDTNLRGWYPSGTSYGTSYCIFDYKTMKVRVRSAIHADNLLRLPKDSHARETFGEWVGHGDGRSKAPRVANNNQFAEGGNSWCSVEIYDANTVVDAE